MSAKRKNRTIVILCILVAACLLASVLLFVLYGGAQEQLQFSTTFNGKVNQWNQTLGTIPRKIPQTTSNEGLCGRYPTYGTAIPDITEAEKDALLAENAIIMASATSYDAMDKDGNLLLGGTPTGKKLYKHTSAVGMYYGNVSDDELAVVERITITANEQRNYVTGLYAPAGEVVKVEISQADLDAIGGSLTIVVGQVSQRNNINNIWKARNDFSRMPVVANKLQITSTTAYVGNPLGGPIYVYPTSLGSTFTVTISGAVPYAHYVHGQTTQAQVEKMQNYSAPYYDFEVWDLGVRISGPSKYGNYNYQNLVQVGNLWEKIIRTSRQVPCSANASISVGFVCDCFVAAGAACAFQGGDSWVNMPCSWMGNALNYQSMVTDGFWGVIHEFNHLYQSYGMENTKTNEVTNNATSLLSYVSYTNISQNRSLDDGDLSGWNRYTDASRSLRETVQNAESGEPQRALNAYADIIHAFGVQTFAQATQLQKGFGVDNWYQALSLATNYNFTFYFENMLNCKLGDEVKALYDTADRTPFVPVATVFQTGRSILQNGNEVFVETMRPYLIARGTSQEINFNTQLVLPSGVTFRIESISEPQSGTLTQLSQNVYRYVPGAEEYSGTIKVKLALESDYFPAQSVTLTLNFRQYDKNQVEVLKYSYDGETKYQSVEEAVANNFDGYTNLQTYNSQSTFLNGLANGQIGIVQGKIYVEKSGNYAFCLRSGRGNNTLYLSVNNPDDLQQVLSLNTDHGGFQTEGEHVVKLNLSAGDYVYFREITLSRHYADAFTELGMANLDEKQSMSTVPAKTLCTNDMQMPVFDFSSQQIFPRVYQTSELLEVSPSSEHTLISTNMQRWDETTDIQNVFDGDPNTFYHNQRNCFVSAQNPFELVADMGKVATFNTLKIISRTSGQLNLPCTFALHVSLDGQNWQQAGYFENLPLVGITVQANFNETSFRYYKLVVTDTKSAYEGNKYVTISSVQFGYAFSGQEQPPQSLSYFGKQDSFREVCQASTFGTLICGNGKMQYSFSGSAFALVVRQQNDCKLKVTVDGVSQTVEVGGSDARQLAVALNLGEGEHTVEIWVQSGTINVDCILVR